MGSLSVSKRERRSDFLDPFDGNALPLLDGERVIRRLQLNRRPTATGAEVQVSLEVQCRRINRDGVAKPSELRRLILDDRRIP